MLAVAGVSVARQSADADTLAALKARYVRPLAIPFPEDNPYSEAKARLGRMLFFDPRLSGDNTLSCAGCHKPELAREDGLPLGVGGTGETLPRHTPTLWNLAWEGSFFWDGRARSLEEQALTPLFEASEMNQDLDAFVPELQSVREYQELFALAFPDDPSITDEKVARAIATFVRTLVSPETPFDRWVAGDEDAVGEAAKRGFLLFSTKANCAACHSGWALTDRAFHDIGLPGDDLGRGPVLGVPEADRAFKTPTLRDVARRALYMHDGSLATLEAVIDHYVDGFVDRPTLSADMRPIDLTGPEKRDLIAFLESLSNPAGASRALFPQIPGLSEVRAGGMPAASPAAGVPSPPCCGDGGGDLTISQKGKRFSRERLEIEVGGTVTFLNDDGERTHNIHVDDPAFTFNSGAQEPGEAVRVTFGEPGTFYVVCGIHPKMQLKVEVK